MDPELALVLRISLEEEKARQEASSKPAGAGSTSATDVGTSGEASKMAVDNDDLTTDEDAELTRALAMSLGSGSASGASNAGPELTMTDSTNEDHELARALAMSMEGNSTASTGVSNIGYDSPFGQVLKLNKLC